MATLGTVNRKRLQVKRLYGLREMKAAQYKELHTSEALQAYYDAEDKLADKLDEYYAASIMFMLNNKPELYELYMKLNKQKVKTRMLRQIVKQKESSLSNQLVINRISDLKQERKKIISNPKKKTRLKYVNSRLAILEAWAKDLNYEERKGKTVYKP